MVHLVVFDIDGTLVDSDEFDGQLYAQAIQDVIGVEVDCDWSHYTNKDAAAALNYDFIAVGDAVAHHKPIADLSDHAAILARLSV